MTSYPPSLSPVTLFNLAMGDLRLGDTIMLNVGPAVVRDVVESGHDLKVTVEVAGFIDVHVYPRWHDVGGPVERAM